MRPSNFYSKTVTQKGKNFQRELIEGQVTAWSKDKYNLFCSQMKESFVARCAMAVYEAKAVSCNLQEFSGQSIEEKDILIQNLVSTIDKYKQLVKEQSEAMKKVSMENHQLKRNLKETKKQLEEERRIGSFF